MWLVGSNHNFSPIATSKITSNSLLTATLMPIYATHNPNNFSPIRKILWLTINVCRLYLESPVIQSHPHNFISLNNHKKLTPNSLKDDWNWELAINFWKQFAITKTLFVIPVSEITSPQSYFFQMTQKNNPKLPENG